MCKKVIISAFTFFWMMVLPAMAGEGFNQEDFHPQDEKYTVIFVSGPTSKKMANECECSVYIDQQSHTVWVLTEKDMQT